MKINALSLFSGAGIGELNLHDKGINFVAANEIIDKRAKCYSFFYPETKMFIGDIVDQKIKENILQYSIKNDVNFLIATPPCQGFSSAGKQKVPEDYSLDKRNFLILEVFDFIDNLNLDYILIENVPRFLKMYFPYNNDFFTLEEILEDKYKSRFNIDIRVLNAKDYGVGQSRPRAIIKLWKKTLDWNWPSEEPEIPLSESIGHLPSLEPGEKSEFKWHNAQATRDNIIQALRHTKPGTSALTNEVYYPKKNDGTRIKGFHNTYKRMTWENPASARTTYSGSVSSHNNVHPGRLRSDGTYSDPRVLSLLETFLVSSINPEIEFPDDASDTFIRTVIGEAIPPKLTEKICFPNKSSFGY